MEKLCSSKTWLKKTGGGDAFPTYPSLLWKFIRKAISGCLLLGSSELHIYSPITRKISKRYDELA